MNTRRTVARRVEEKDVNDEKPPQVEQVPQGDKVLIVEGGNNIPMVPPELTNRDIREVLLSFARSVTTKVNLSMDPRVNVMESPMTSRLGDFVRMKPLIFLVSKIGEDPQEFLYGVY
ncbi:hypothetical protein EJD97_021900 [Solanum chilense]|uniref:Uncharacterized protein n=1 Tax=Solanum chilense TaxID=4083 RepID=A0A6N2CC05_SOLCI|nr:hypothetical protein EJD97_021900 [Solanum chilense]